MTKNQDKVISLVLTDIEAGTVITEELISSKVDFFSIAYPLNNDERHEVITNLHARLSIRMDRGSCVKEKDHITWYYTAKRNLDTTFWDRYRLYLSKNAGFNPEVINSMDAATDEMMDMLGNPTDGFDFQRRGLVIGDVQSGKTSTYAALINKAADAGYRIIILLTGTIEKLRRQTQGRLDEAFVGLDSTAFNRDKDSIFIGVGNINPSISAWAVTSTSSDFNTSTASKLSGKLSSIHDPVLFVLKKNKTVLEKLEQWMRLYNANQVDKKIHMPMLLIDDEADNASVNTRGDDDVTVINANIRKLLKLFVQSNYVGFTATPYANIFIDPESTQEMLDDDLFPRDFIYALEAPTNYVGAIGVFSEEGRYSYMLKENDDCAQYLPLKHKIHFVPQELPYSMKEAIASFFIANAVRDLRGDQTKHRSMLINISRFIAVQDQIQRAVDGYVREFQRDIKNYYLIGDEALQYESFIFLKKVYDIHFSRILDFEFDWATIQKALHEAIASIVVRTVNGGNATKNLNYDECEEQGLRLITVGGYSLSRGLTLEGLCVSYFYRNSKMYDTLMQMGRWFGYRDNYADICQIWMEEDAVEWYRYISVASEELRREIKRMQFENKTPQDFGLCVRSDINTLLVTARNKMRTAKDYELAISLNGKVVETPYLHHDKEIILQNLNLTENWIAELINSGFVFSEREDLAIKHPQILNVPKKYIMEYIGNYKSHYFNMDFRTSELVGLIENYEDDTVDNWDIVIAANGNGRGGKCCGILLNFIERKFDIKESVKALQLSGSKSRLGSANYAKAGLSKKEAQEIENAEREEQKRKGVKHAFSQELYFNSGIKRNPMLVIYPVELSPKIKLVGGEIHQDPDRQAVINEVGVPAIGLSIGIPRINGRQAVTYQYKINLVKYKELLDLDDDYGEFDDTIIDSEVSQ